MVSRLSKENNHTNDMHSILKINAGICHSDNHKYINPLYELYIYNIKLYFMVVISIFIFILHYKSNILIDLFKK